MRLTKETVNQIKEDLTNRYGPDDALPIGEIISFMTEVYVNPPKQERLRKVTNFTLDDIFSKSESLALALLRDAGYNGWVGRRDGISLPYEGERPIVGSVKLIVWKNIVNNYTVEK